MEVSAAEMHLAAYKPDGVHYPVADWLGTKRVTVGNPIIALRVGCDDRGQLSPVGA